MSKAAWHFVSEQLHREFGDHPEKIFTSGVVVKSNLSRKVLKSKGIYLKLDRRKFHSFKPEIKIARQLNNVGLPTVEMIAYGKVGNNFALLSRELPGGVAFDTYLHSQMPSPPMCQALIAFVRKWINSLFYHRDLHAGNLLCVPAEKRFVLVDLHAVRRKRFWQHRPDYEAARLFLALRRQCTREEIVQMIADAGVPEPENFYDYALKKEANILLGEWSRRKKQILHGYPKFSRIENDRLIAANCQHFQHPERQSNGRTCFLAHVLLTIAEIPHRQATELDLLTGEVLLAPRPQSMLPPPSALCDEMRERLALYGIKSCRQDWSIIPGENLPVLINLAPVTEAIERWETLGL